MIMVRGKETCRILKEIRSQIAEANDIELVTSECRYKGDCPGTCPKCESELRYLEQKLNDRRLAGKAIVIAGISASALSVTLPSVAQVQPDRTCLTADSLTISVSSDSFVVKGLVTCRWTPTGETVEMIEALAGACVMNRNTKEGTFTDVDGNFEINACCGDLIEISFIGYKSAVILVSDSSKLVNVTLDDDSSELMGEVVVVKPQHYMDFNVVDENDNRISPDSIYIDRLFVDEYGKEYYEDTYWKYIDEKKSYRVYWYSGGEDCDKDSGQSKNVTFRIKAEGYEEPISVNVRRYRYKFKKTIRFKH